LPAENGPDNFAATLTEVSENLTKLVQDELELAKAEMVQKATSLGRGVGATAAGAVFGVFAVIFVLLTIAWAIDAIFVDGVGDIWLGFGIVALVLVVLTAVTFLFAWKKLQVGAPTPQMAIDEAKKIRDTVSSSAGKPSLPESRVR
jgi:Putative Actinobacterial Holin-X, holin superfamily III